MTDTLDIDPCTLEDARRTIKTLLERLLHTQEIAINRGIKLIALNEEKLGADKKALATGLGVIAKTVQYWIEWNKDQRDQESIETEDGTHIMALPVTAWPSHGQLRTWVKTMESAADILNQPHQ